jgi:CBS domain-containing protein
MLVPDPIVAEIMRTDVPTISPSDSIATIARLMSVSGLPGLPVVENGEIIGIVTESDLIVREADVEIPTLIPFLDTIFRLDAGRDFDDEMRHLLAVSARDIMTSPVINIKQSATIQQLATVILDENVNPVPVLDDEYQLVGIVSRAEIIKVIAKLEAPTSPASEGESPIEPND